MGRTHCCFDNARMESFFTTLKKELVYPPAAVVVGLDPAEDEVTHQFPWHTGAVGCNTANEDNLPPLVKRTRFSDYPLAV